MLDEPDPKRDQKLSEHVMRLHNHKKRKRSEFENTSFNHLQQNNSDVYSQINMNFDNFMYGKKDENQHFRKSLDENEGMEGQFVGNRYQSLGERLNKMCERINKTLQTHVLKKYIAYIKKNIHPYFKNLNIFYKKIYLV